MLKLSYTEVGLYLERTITVPELLIAQRVILATRLGQPLYLEPGRASFLLPANVAQLEQLAIALQEGCNSTVTILAVDDQFVEISLCGSWIADSQDAHEGMFLTVLDDRTEACIYKLWEMSEAQASSLV